MMFAGVPSFLGLGLEGWRVVMVQLSVFYGRPCLNLVNEEVRKASSWCGVLRLTKTCVAQSSRFLGATVLFVTEELN